MKGFPIHIIPMTADELRLGGKLVSIRYSYAQSHFGQTLIASTPKGICYIAFGADQTVLLSELKQRFPRASYLQAKDVFQTQVWEILSNPHQFPHRVTPLHIHGTPFQMKVWKQLTLIPFGKRTTYSKIASEIGCPRATRAVGSAIGANPISLLIPCHRVIRKSGEWGGYHWGLSHKIAILSWEASLTEPELFNE